MHSHFKTLHEFSSVFSCKILILEKVLIDTSELLRSYKKGFVRNEGIVYWAGYENEQNKIITTVIAPKAITTWGSFDTTEIDNANVIKSISRWKSLILAQVHSHPGAIVEHSEGDDKKAFMPYSGFLSVVVPHYAKKGMLPLNFNGFHIYLNNRFYHLGEEVISSIITIVPHKIDLRLESK